MTSAETWAIREPSAVRIGAQRGESRGKGVDRMATRVEEGGLEARHVSGGWKVRPVRRWGSKVLGSKATARASA